MVGKRNLNGRVQMVWKQLRDSLTSSNIKRLIVGMTLYGSLTIPFNTMWIPTTGLVALRPTIVIPLLFGFLFGPVVGFTTGLFGNLISDFFPSARSSGTGIL